MSSELFDPIREIVILQATIATLTAERDAYRAHFEACDVARLQMAKERDALAARVKALEDKHNRIFICLWCGAELDTGCTPHEAQENPEKVGELVRRCQEHDAHCPNNPLAARVKELELAVRAGESAQAVLVQRIADLEHDLHLAEQGHANAH